MDEKEDEISIDFSKIKGFFKRKQQDAKPEVKEEAKDSQVAANTDAPEIKKDEDEIAIDLSKIKNIFKKKEKSVYFFFAVFFSLKIIFVNHVTVLVLRLGQK